jgi:hypothetical protein
MDLPTPITSVETLPNELLEWLGEKKIKPGEGDVWVFPPVDLQSLCYHIG